MPPPARTLRARMPCPCLHVPCPCLRVHAVCACVPYLFSLHNVDVGIPLRSDIPLARVFQGEPTHQREHPAQLATVLAFYQPGYQTQNPPFVCPCPADRYMQLALLYLSVFHSVLLPQHDRPTYIHTHINTHTYTHIRRRTPQDTPKDMSHTHQRTSSYILHSTLQLPHNTSISTHTRH